MTKEQRTNELYRAAYKCEEAKAHGCQRGEQCNSCPLNILAYTGFGKEDQCDAALIQTAAAIDHYAASIQEGQQFWTNIFKILLIVIPCFFIWRACSKPKEPPTEVLVPRSEIAQLVKETKAHLYDINQDGLINCIDYALIYCMLCPKSQIILNNNPNTGMNHLFVAMWIENNNDSRWIYVEPQYHSGGQLMTEVWGKKYDPKYNVNETHTYLTYALVEKIFGRGNKEYAEKFHAIMYERANFR